MLQVFVCLASGGQFTQRP